MADVEVSFGAKLEELITGIDTAKEALSSLGETLGIGFTIAGIAEFISQMQELGEQTTRTAAMLGTSTVEAQKLGIEAKLAGGSSEAMAISLERMQVNLATAGNESSRAGQALKVLGLSAKDIVGLPIPEQLNKIADAVSGFADGGTKTAAVMALLGRGGAQLIPLLDEGSKGFDEFNKRMIDAGAVVAPDVIAKLTTLQQNFTLLKASFIGLGETLVASLVPATTALTQLIADIQQTIAAGVLWQRAMLDIKAAAVDLALEIMRLGVIAKDVFTLNWSEIGTHWANGEKAIADNAAKWTSDLASLMEGAKKKIQSELGAATAGGANLPAVPAMQIGGGAGGEAMKAADEQIKAIELVYKTAVDAAAARVKLGELSQGQETAIVLSEIDKRVNAELAAINKVESGGNVSAKQREQLEARKTQIVQQGVLDRQKATEKELETEKAAFDKIGNDILSAWNSNLRSLLDGSENFSTALQKTFGDMVIKLIEMLEQVIVKMMILLAFEAATGTGGGGIGAAFSASFGKVFGLKEGSWSVGSAGAFPSYQTGTLSAPGTELALLHSGEMVIPASPAQQIRDAISGGGTGGGNSVAATFNLSAWDASSVQQWLRGGGAAMIARQVAQVMNNNPTLRPSY